MQLFCLKYNFSTYYDADWQWVVKGVIDVDIGANPSTEGGEDEILDDTAVKVVDIVDTFRLQVNTYLSFFFSF